MKKIVNHKDFDLLNDKYPFYDVNGRTCQILLVVNFI